MPETIKTGKGLAAVMLAVFLLAAPEDLQAGIPTQTVNQYIYCRDMVVRTPFIHGVKEPRLEGVLVNRTVFGLSVKLKLRFYNVFSEMLEEVDIEARLSPKERLPFRKTLSNREEIDRIRNPYRLEWEVVDLEVDKNPSKR
ncbi:MAG: hypothetical protein ACOC0W_06815 [Desulfosalsimonas sp.]